MKKALTIAAIAFCVCAAQAAQVSWTVADVNKGGSNITGAGVGYLFNAATYTTAQVEAAIKDGTFSSLTHVGNVATIDEEEPGYLAAGKKDDSNIAANTQYTFFAVVFDSNDTSSGNYIVTSPKTITTKGSGSTAIPFGSQASNNTWTPVSEVIPEPTTVALLALGLAALGLKRKIA